MNVLDATELDLDVVKMEFYFNVTFYVMCIISQLKIIVWKKVGGKSEVTARNSSL